MFLRTNFRPLLMTGALALLSGTSADAVVPVRTVALTGQQAPGMPGGVDFLNFGPPVLNGAGHTAFAAFLFGPGVDGASDTSIWSESGGVLTLVAREGSPAPDTPMGVNFGQFSTIFPLLDGAGRTAFLSTLTGAGVNATNDSGVWSEGGGTLALVARKGAPVPGTTMGVTYDIFVELLYEAGRTAFFATLTGAGVTGANDAGIWSEGPGVLTLIAREGSPAPDTAPGVNFSSVVQSFLNHY